METLINIFGQGKELSPIQMCTRALCVFFICLLFIRLSGRRSFGMNMPLDNVITVLLGAVLSRAVTGASPFVSTVASAGCIALLHRFCAWIALYSDAFGNIVKGEASIIYREGKLMKKTMRRFMITEKDLMESVRINSNMDSLEKIKTIFVERDGQISIVKK